MSTASAVGREVAGRLLAGRTVRGRALGAAARRRRALVLLYHRIAEPSAVADPVVPTVAPDRFAAHLDALAAEGEVVPLTDLLGDGPAPSSRPRFALSFDDDDPAHVAGALPVLASREMTATFFLSGRALAGRGPYWWQVLEQAVAERGPAAVAAELGLGPGDSAGGDGAGPGAGAWTARRLAGECERRRLAERAASLPVAQGGAAVLDEAGIGALAAAGMGIGFHTVDHPVLTDLPPGDRGDAVTRGRSELAAAAGAPVDVFAYPHGRADAAVADEVRRAGYLAACTTVGRAVRPGSDPYAIGRWEPGDTGVDALLAGAAARLLRVGAPSWR